MFVLKLNIILFPQFYSVFSYLIFKYFFFYFAPLKKNHKNEMRSIVYAFDGSEYYSIHVYIFPLKQNNV